MKISTAVALLLALWPLALRARDRRTAAGDEGSCADGGHEATGPPSKSVNLSFEGKTVTLSLTDLVNMPNQVTVHVRNAHRGGIEETYSGPCSRT